VLLVLSSLFLKTEESLHCISKPFARKYSRFKYMVQLFARRQCSIIASFFSIISIAMATSTSPRQKVASVTGGNKGIGFEIAKNLGSSDKNILTIIGCRDSSLGQAAVERLQSSGCNVIFKQLDISDESSIENLRTSIDEEFGRLDILVNNAAIAYKGSDPTPFRDQARPTMAINFFGTLSVTRALLPLLRKSQSPRIVNVASMAGHLRILPTTERKATFSSDTLQTEELESLIREFVTDVENGVHSRNGWPNTCYGMSKLGVIALTKILSRDEPSIMVNACCPGYCSTDMSSNKGPRTAEHGARTPAMLALMPDSKAPNIQPSGKYFSDEAEEAW
jgi:carbonyl reductase 1